MMASNPSKDEYIRLAGEVAAIVDKEELYRNQYAAAAVTEALGKVEAGLPETMKYLDEESNSDHFYALGNNQAIQLTQDAIAAVRAEYTKEQP